MKPYETVDGADTTLLYYNKQLDRNYELACPVGTIKAMSLVHVEIDVLYIERTKVQSTGRVLEALKSERVLAFLGLENCEAVAKYEQGHRDADGEFSALAVILSESAGVPYGTLLPVQFNGHDFPTVFRDAWDVNSLRLHPAIQAYRVFHQEARKRQQLIEAGESRLEADRLAQELNSNA